MKQNTLLDCSITSNTETGLHRPRFSFHLTKIILDFLSSIVYNFTMAKELTVISPEGMEVANSYLQFGNIRAVVENLGVPEYKVTEILNKREVKKYIDTVFLDTGYRNKNNIAAVLDEMIASKLEEAQETGVYSSKDLADLLQMAHKMRMDELKAQTEAEKTTGLRSQTNVQINEGVPFGQGNYGKLMDKLLKDVN